MKLMKENEKCAYLNGDHVDTLIYYGPKEGKYQFYRTNTKEMIMLTEADLENVYQNRNKSAWPENVKSLYSDTLINNIKMKAQDYETQKNHVLEKLEEFKKMYHYDELKNSYDQTAQAVNNIVNELQNLMKSATNK